MGNMIVSSPYSKWTTQLQQLQLTDVQIKFLHALYSGGQNHGTDGLPIEQLILNLKIKNYNVFTYKAFGMNDVGGVEMVTFPEFVFALWRICTQTSRAIAELAFDIYDKESYVSLPLSVLGRIIRDVNDGSTVDVHHTTQRALQELTDLGDQHGIVSRDSFTAVMKDHPALMYPVNRLQIELRYKAFGKAFWDERTFAVGEESLKSGTSDRYRGRTALESAVLADEKYINMQWLSSSTKARSIKRTYATVQPQMRPVSAAVVLVTDVVDTVDETDRPHPSYDLMEPHYFKKPAKVRSKSAAYFSPFTLHNLEKSGRIRSCSLESPSVNTECAEDQSCTY